VPKLASALKLAPACSDSSSVCAWRYVQHAGLWCGCQCNAGGRLVIVQESWGWVFVSRVMALSRCMHSACTLRWEPNQGHRVLFQCVSSPELV
jgi:hypothetical protein